MARSTPAATQQRTRVSDKAGQGGTAGAADAAGNPWPLRIGLGVAAAVVVGVLLWAPWRSTGPTLVPALVTEAPVSGPGVATFETPGGTTAPIATMSPDEVELALRQAEAYLEQGTRVVGSEGVGLRGHEDTALGKFHAVLAVEPGNARAQAGVAAVGGYYRDSAAKLCAAERWVGCAAVADYGLEALPDDPELLKLKESAESAQRGL